MKQAHPKSEADKQAKRQAFQGKTAGAPKEAPGKQPRQAGVGAANARSMTAAGGGKQEQATPQGTVKAEALDPAIAGKLKGSYGVDLGDVVVRSGAGADAECAKRGCAAFALSGVITMSSKAGEPGSAGYNKILLHECAHIVQQRLGKSPDAKKAQAHPDAAAKPDAPAGAHEEPKTGGPVAKGGKAAAGKAAAGAAPEGKQGGSTAAKEAEADKAAESAGAGKKAEIKQAAPTQAAQHAPTVAAAAPAGAAPAGGARAGGAKAPEAEHGSPTTVTIPLGGDRSIVIKPPNKDGDWEMGVSDIIKMTNGDIKKDVSKWWRKSIPTPFFGLAVELGVQIGAELKLEAPSLKKIVVRRKTRDKQPWYEIAGTVGTGLSIGGFAALTAGVSADVWIASAGVGIKAKLALEASKGIEADIAFGYNPATGDFGVKGQLDFKSWELALKGSIGLFAYYDAIGVSTYCKDWTLYERELGKMSLGGIAVPFGWSKNGGFTGKVDGEGPKMQDIEGNVKNMFPSRA